MLGNTDDTIACYYRPWLPAARVGGERVSYLSHTPATSHCSKPYTRESTWGINRKSQRKFEAHPQLELSENDLIAKSHPAVGTPRTSSQSL